MAALPTPAVAQEESPEELSRILGDFTVAACRNDRGSVPPGLQAGSCDQVIEKFGFGPQGLAVVHFLRGYAYERMAKEEDDKRDYRRRLIAASGEQELPVSADDKARSYREAIIEERKVEENASKARSDRNREKAFADYAISIRLDPQLAWREFNRGVTGDLDPVIEGEAVYASHVYGRGIAALRLGRTAEGQADIARAAAMDAAVAEAFAEHGIQP